MKIKLILVEDELYISKELNENIKEAVRIMNKYLLFDGLNNEKDTIMEVLNKYTVSYYWNEEEGYVATIEIEKENIYSLLYKIGEKVDGMNENLSENKIIYLKYDSRGYTVFDLKDNKVINEIIKNLNNAEGSYRLNSFLNEFKEDEYIFNGMEAIEYVLKMKDLKEANKRACEFIDECKKEKREEREALLKENEHLFVKARETKEKQLIERFSRAFKEKNGDTNLELINLYAMPDGSSDRKSVV